MVWLPPTAELHCISWTLLPPLLLELVLLVLILWRTFHQLYWRSRCRRILLHMVLLVACAFRFLFWLSLCQSSVLTLGIACLWWSNSIVLLCTAAVIFQWSSALTAGRVPALRSKRLTIILHPLGWLHSVHFLWTSVMAIRVLVCGFTTSHSIVTYPRNAAVLFFSHRVVNIVTLLCDAGGACYVARQLRHRLLAAAMTDEIKQKSVRQLVLLLTLVMASVTLQIFMDVPTFFSSGQDSWPSLTFAAFCIIKYLVPGLWLSLAFLYIMRRVEQREPTRLVVGPSCSLVEFVECSSPDCVWCAHHRQYHVTQNKWDVTLMTSLSPRTVDSSYHSSIHANLSQGSWSSETTPEPLPDASHLSRDCNHRLHQAYPSHRPMHPTRERIQFPIETHGDYERPREVPGWPGARYS